MRVLEVFKMILATFALLTLPMELLQLKIGLMVPIIKLKDSVAIGS